MKKWIHEIKWWLRIGWVMVDEVAVEHLLEVPLKPAYWDRFEVWQNLRTGERRTVLLANNAS